MSVLFDKHDRPILANMSAEDAWAACDEFEDYVYNIAESLSDDSFDRMIADVCALRREYYDLFEN